MNNSEDKMILKPFVLTLPDNQCRYTILNSSNSKGMHSGYVTLKKDENIGEHSTNNYEEMIIVLEGEGEIEAEGLSRRKIKAGQVVYNPPFTKHNVFNADSAILRYIYVAAKML